MDNLIKPLDDLIEKFRSLNGVGKKSAMIYWGIMTRNYRMLRKLCK